MTTRPGNLAALVAYYAFFSLFPLLLVFVTILGLRPAGRSQRAEVDRELGARPVSRRSAQQDRPHALHGSAVALVIGLLASLWAGLGVTQAAQNALDRVWAVPLKDRPNFIHSRLRGLALLVASGSLFIVAYARLGTRHRRARRARC